MSERNQHMAIVKQIQDYIKEHLNEPMTAKDIAKAVGYSQYHVSRMFKEEVGLALFEYIRKQRLIKSAYALRNEDVRVLDIALDFVFDSHEGFTRAFSNAFGITPKKYASYPNPNGWKMEIDLRNEYDEKRKCTILPHKKIAVLSGLGWIGKNNLLVTEQYGSALAMCSVLTDMPLKVKEASIILPKCGKCKLCVEICPVQALHGTTWEKGMDRDRIVDVYRCITCLKCMAGCRYRECMQSVKYQFGVIMLQFFVQGGRYKP